MPKPTTSRGHGRGLFYTHEVTINPEDHGLPVAARFKLIFSIDHAGVIREAFPRILGQDNLPRPALRDQLIEHHQAEILDICADEVEDLIARWTTERLEAEAWRNASERERAEFDKSL